MQRILDQSHGSRWLMLTPNVRLQPADALRCQFTMSELPLSRSSRVPAGKPVKLTSPAAACSCARPWMAGKWISGFRLARSVCSHSKHCQLAGSGAPSYFADIKRAADLISCAGIEHDGARR